MCEFVQEVTVVYHIMLENIHKHQDSTLLAHIVENQTCVEDDVAVSQSPQYHCSFSKESDINV